MRYKLLHKGICTLCEQICPYNEHKKLGHKSTCIDSGLEESRKPLGWYIIPMSPREFFFLALHVQQQKVIHARSLLGIFERTNLKELIQTLDLNNQETLVVRSNPESVLRAGPFKICAVHDYADGSTVSNLSIESRR